MRLSLKLHLDYSFHIAYSEIFPFTVCLLNLIQFDWHGSQKALHFTVCTGTHRLTFTYTHTNNNRRNDNYAEFLSI